MVKNHEEEKIFLCIKKIFKNNFRNLNRHFYIISFIQIKSKEKLFSLTLRGGTKIKIFICFEKVEW